MKKILCITNMESTMTGMKKAAGLPQVPEGAVSVVQTGDEEKFSHLWEKEAKAAGAVIILWMGTGLSCDFLKKLHGFLVKEKIPFFIHVSDLEKDKESGAMTEDEVTRIKAYLSCGGLLNYGNLISFLLDHFSGAAIPCEMPRELPYWGIYDPDEKEASTDTESYIRSHWKEDRPAVGLIFSREDWLWGNLDWQPAMIEALRKEGCHVLAVFTSTSDYNGTGVPTLGDNMKDCFYVHGNPVIQVLLNPFLFGLTTAGFVHLSDLKQLGVPILQVYNTYRDYRWWSTHFAGLTANELSYAVAMPEFDGVIHGLPLSTQEVREDGTHYHRPLPERMAALARRARKWAMLSRKKNGDKKVAIIFHNYPPDNSHIGSASQIDSIESIRRLLRLLKKRGYRVDRVPEDAQSFINEVTAHATNDRRYISSELLDHADGKISSADYGRFFSGLPEKTKAHMKKDWGDPPGEVFCHGGDLIVPGMLDGHVFITVQPPRGFGENPGKIYHSPDMAPPHQYLGFYEWIRNVWKADAMIHVGTHGNLEWLPGKGVALSDECYPDINTGDVPDIYPYWITDVGEGIQAKRRSASCLISYLSAPTGLAGAYDEYGDLENLLEEYCHFRKDEEMKGEMEKIRTLIRQQAEKCHLEKDAPEEQAKDFDDYVGALHNFITDLKNMQISLGLHNLGEPPKGEELENYLFALTKLDNGKIPSLLKTLSTIHGHSYYELLEDSGTLDSKTGLTYGMLLDRVSGEAREIIHELARKGFDAEKVPAILSLSWTKVNPSEEEKEKVLETARYICTDIAPHLEETTLEMGNLLRALDGQFVDPSPSGAPTSGGADLLPTGRNFYSIDPRALPTEPAWEIGKQMADNVIEKFIADEGHYPESCGIILWATSNLRNHGTCIAEFLYLMGLKPVWQAGSHRVVGVEVIPLSELKRPRIDVTGRISGLFRDSLPASVSWLDQAAGKVAALDEPDDMNYVRKHVREEAGELEKEGLDKEEAWREAGYRIFGDPPGCHGAGIGALLEGKNWQNVNDMAAVYTRWGGYAYGKGAEGTYLPKRFEKRMSQIQVTIQNVDQRESSMLSSDDYNSYRGGLVAAVRSASGKMPKNYVNDSSDQSRVVIRTLDEELKRWFRGEAMNPKYIEGMKKHGYKGAGDLAEYLAVSFQWDATSEIMDDWMYDQYAEKYVLDADMQNWMKKVNPWALKRMVDTLLEARQRDMWNADDKTVEELEKLMLDVEGELEDDE